MLFFGILCFSVYCLFAQIMLKSMLFDIHYGKLFKSSLDYALHQEYMICYVPQHSRLEQLPVLEKIHIGIQTSS